MNKKENILVVDDNQSNLLLLCGLLNDEGYITFPADSGELALASLEENVPDLILLDIRMPIMNGFEVCIQIKQNKDLKDIPIIFLTAATQIEEKIKGFEHGAVDYITKPFEKDELLIRIDTHLSLRRKEKELILAKEKAEKSEYMFKSLFDQTAEGIILMTQTGNLVQVNKSFAEMHGYTPDEIERMNIFDLDVLKEKTFENRKLILEKVLSGETVQLEVEHYHKNANVFPISVIAQLLVLGEQKYLLCFHQDLTKRNKAEEILIKAKKKAEKNERKYRALSYNIPGMIYSAKKDWTINIINNSEQICGYSEDDFMQNKICWTDIIHPDDKVEVFKESGILLKQPISIIQEYRIITKDNSVRYIADNKTSIFTTKMNFKGVDGIVFDITEQKKAKEVLHQYKHIVSSSTDMMALLDKHYTYLAVNKSYVDAFNLAQENLIGNTVDKIFGEEIFNTVIKPKAKKCLLGEIVNYSDWFNFPAIGSCYMDINYYPYYNEKNEVIGFVVNGRNITEQKKATDEIKRAYDIIQNIQTGLHIYHLENIDDDKTLKMVYANPVSEKLTGVRPDDVVGKTLDENFPGLRKKGIPQKYANVVKTGKLLEIEDIYYGDNRVLESFFIVKVFPLPRNHVGIAFENVSDKKKAEIEIIAAKENAEKHKHELQERLKELQGIYSLGLLAEKYDEIEPIFNEFVNDVLPKSLRFPDKVYAYLEIGNKVYCNNLKYSLPSNKKSLSAKINVFKKQKGKLVVTYTEELPFIEIHEQKLINAYAERISKIAERIKAEQALKESETRLTELFNNMGDGCVVYSKVKDENNYIIKNYNKAGERIDKIKRKDIIDKKLTEVFPGVKDFGLLNVLQRVHKTGLAEHFPASIYRDNRIQGWRENFVYKLSHSDELVAIYNDVTEKKQTEQALIESQQNFSDLFNKSNDSIIISDLKGKIHQVNDTACYALGYANEELLDKKFIDLISENTKNKTIVVFAKIKKQGNAIFETEYITKKGHVIPYEMNCSTFNYFGKEAILLTGRDITERKLIERKILNTIIETEEQERDRFSRDLHDGLGPMLSSIKIYFQWLAKTNDSEKKEMIIEKGSAGINETIETLKEISNNISPRILNRFGLVSALESFIDRIRETSVLNLVFNTNVKIRLNSNIEITLYRITTELINNTIKHANAKKIIINLIIHNDSNFLEMYYTDDGIGVYISEKSRKSLGLGIDNIQQRINILGGEFFLNSDDNGMMIRIILPFT